MTLAFEKFMKQYKMTGSEKADGYSPDVFMGLDKHEKDEVFKLLLTELPWSAEWIFLLDPERALVAAKEKEREIRGDGYAHTYMLQQQIVKYSGDLNYQNHIIEDYAKYADRLKPYVVDAVNRTPINDSTIAFFKRVIMAETNASAVARASRHLLSAVRFPRTTEAEKIVYNRMMAELRSDNVQLKLRAFRKIENLNPIGG